MSRYTAHRTIALKVGIEGEDTFYIQDRKFKVHDYTGPHMLRLMHENPGVKQILVVTDKNWADLPGGLRVMSDPGAAPGEVLLVASGLEAWPILNEAQQAERARNSAGQADRSLDGPR